MSNKHKRYEKINHIGEGTFAHVYKARDKETNIEVAIKKIKIGNYQEAQDGVNRTALREIKILLELHHENVVTLLDVFDKDSSISLVFNLMETDLERIVHDRNIWLSFAHIKSYILMTLKGIEYLHQNFILHRDLKPNNLLLDRYNILKIADFGLARTFGSPTRIYSHQVVTRWYRAPELLYGSRMYGTGIDIWAVGCILAELFKREALFRGESDLECLDLIVTLLGTPTEKNWHGVTELPDYVEFNDITEGQPLSEKFSALQQDALDVLGSMLRLCPAERCNATEALAMPYFTNEPYPTPPEMLPRTRPASPPESDIRPVQRPQQDLESELGYEGLGDGLNIKLEPMSEDIKPTKAKRLKFD